MNHSREQGSGRRIFIFFPLISTVFVAYLAQHMLTELDLGNV